MREVVLDGASDQRPAVVYGAAEVALQLVFDAPLQKTDAGVVVVPPGVDARPHAYRDDALIITPSRALSERSAVPLQVPLANGVAALTLAFSPERTDHVLRVIRRQATVPDAGVDTPLAEFEGPLSVTAYAVLQGNGCSPVKPLRPQPMSVPQAIDLQERALVCAVGPHSYLRVQRKQFQCVPSAAQLLRGQQVFEALLLGPAEPCGERTCQQVVVRTPPEKMEDYVLELLAADGTVCERYERLTLAPGGAP